MMDNNAILHSAAGGLELGVLWIPEQALSWTREETITLK